MAAIPSNPVNSTSFPPFEPLRIRLPLAGADLTIWPGPKQSRWEWALGFPLELRPFAWDYMWISCTTDRVEIQPHYLESTWDTFWTDLDGSVTAHALGGLFPFTLGNEVDLLKGIVATLDALPAHIRDHAPETADKIKKIHAILAPKEAPPVPLVRPEMTRLRRTASEAVWRRKLRSLPIDTNDGP